MIIHSYHINTQPGARGNNPFTPPRRFIGSDNDYAQLIIDRERLHPQLFAVIRRRHRVSACLHLSGPYTDQAKRIIGIY